MIAPTPEVLEQLYIKHDAFVERGLAWDRNELAMIEAWEARKQMLDETQPDLRQQIGAVHEWNPNMPKTDLIAEQDEIAAMAASEQ